MATIPPIVKAAVESGIKLGLPAFIDTLPAAVKGMLPTLESTLGMTLVDLLIKAVNWLLDLLATHHIVLHAGGIEVEVVQGPHPGV